MEPILITVMFQPHTQQVLNKKLVLYSHWCDSMHVSIPIKSVPGTFL